MKAVFVVVKNSLFVSRSLNAQPDVAWIRTRFSIRSSDGAAAEGT